MMHITGAGTAGSPLLTLLSKIPEWQAQLSKLNESMDNRQIELAEAAVHYRPNPSLKRMGSCESLRPNDDPGLGVHMEEGAEDKDTKMVNGTNATTAPPRLLRNSTSPGPIRNSSHRRLAAAGISKRDSAPILRKRKTTPESINSVTSAAKTTKQRTRSMIIVYYEGSVQTAFNDICTSISQVRNGLRKGKMARMMRGTASRASLLDKHRLNAKDLPALGDLGDLEVGPTNGGAARELGDLEAGMNLEADDLLPDLEAEAAPAVTSTNGTTTMALEADNTIDVQPDDSESLPPLQYRSTRRMNPNLATTASSRQILARHEKSKPQEWNSGPARHTSEDKKDESKDVFDDLDAGLERASKICEDAAHEFLKYGSCRVEIQKVEVWLRKVKERAEKGLEECPDMAVASQPTVPAPRKYGYDVRAKFAAAGTNGGLGDLGDLAADDGLGDLEADDMMGDLEADDMMGDLEVDDVSTPVKPAKQAQFITVIKPDVQMDLSNHDLSADVSSLSMKSADEAVTPLDDMAQHKKLNMENMKSNDVLAKYRVGRNANAKLIGKTMDVHEVHIGPLNRVS